jgi:Mor family transcriptional regulator
MEYNKIVSNKYFVYYLGFLWSDGFIERKRVGIEILNDDAIQILDDIKKIDFLKICTMSRHRPNRRPQMTIYFCNVNFYNDFISKYFISKSNSSPNSLLDLIPDYYRRFFYQGLIDGDGCFYFDLKNKTRQFYVTSSYDQDWSHMESLFKLLNISQYEIRRVINKNGNKSSYIRVKKYKEIESLYSYLYPNGYEIGLKRKYDKCSDIINNPPIYSSNKSKIDLNLLISDINSGIKIMELSKIYDCNWRKIYDCCKKNKIEYPKGFFSDTSKNKVKVLKVSKFLSYDDARLYVISQSIKNQKEWDIFSKNSRPDNIPSNPRVVYKTSGWISLKHWLGI